MRTASKAALIAFARCLAMEVVKRNIRVNCLSPALVETPLLDATAEITGTIEEERKNYPLGFGKPDDVANAGIFLLSDASRWITGTTLVIHDREAHADVLRVLHDEGPPERVVFHCFSGDAAMARICAACGYWMSFAGNVTFKNAAELRAAAAAVPVELLLVETDAPFLTPVPYRGRPNASYLVPLTVRALADVRGVDLDRLCGAIAANGRQAFAL